MRKYPIVVGDVIHIKGHYDPYVNINGKMATVHYTNTPGNSYYVGNIEGGQAHSAKLTREQMTLLSMENYPELYI